VDHKKINPDNNCILAFDFPSVLMLLVKLAFHDVDMDTDSDSPDTSVYPYVRYSRGSLRGSRCQCCGNSICWT